jgi:hypothetical protein
MKAGHEEMNSMAEYQDQEVRNEEASVETARAPKDRSGDRRVAVRRRCRLTRRAAPALHKGHGRKGPGKRHS